MFSSMEFARAEQWFEGQGWTPFPFQRETWEQVAGGASGLVHAPTGVGKTYALWFPLVEELVSADRAPPSGEVLPLSCLWVTPLRALAQDTCDALKRPVEDLGLPITVETRTGDTASAVRNRQKTRLPTCLVTTPESLTLILSYPDWKSRLRHLRMVVVDEWHELLGTKRGVQTELALARIRSLHPGIRTWGCSATIRNLEEAACVLTGTCGEPVRVAASMVKAIELETLLPEAMERFPWAGHLGTRMVGPVVGAINRARSTLVFTNTRSQAENWFKALQSARPGVDGKLGIHHGSVDRDQRRAIESGLDQGQIRAVVCTSSLDLGVDFSPVDQVIQIGSPKGVARLMQRAGRSGHQPGGISRIVGVPTNAFELVEFAAVRDAIEAGEVEARNPLERPLDVLLQHLVTVALGGGFREADLLAEVRSTHAYAELEDVEWRWAIDFLANGGRVLSAYPDFHRIVLDQDEYRAGSPRVSRMHRMSIGTITSDSAVTVRMQRGGTLGSVEESFLSRLRTGETFHFAGRHLELVRLRDFVATVRPARGQSGNVPSWQGGRSPLSTELAEAVRSRLRRARDGDSAAPEMRRVRAVLEQQTELSELPGPGQLLVEHCRVRRRYHLFVFPFGGRLVHEGLATLMAFRMSRERPLTVRATYNDYGFGLELSRALDLDEASLARWMGTAHLLDDLLECMNTTELARRQFREISRVAGLVLQGYPGREKSARQVQSSSGLLFDVFERYDPQNKLLDQARREILSRQLDLTRLKATLKEISRSTMVVRSTPRLTPMAFPLWAARLSENVSSESVQDQIDSMLRELESARKPPSDAPGRHRAQSLA